MNVRIAGRSAAYAPGDNVELSLAVSDEHGSPAPAVLTASVVDDAMLKLTGGGPPRMTTHFRLASELDKPEELEDADFYLSDGEEAVPIAIPVLLTGWSWSPLQLRAPAC